MTQPNRPNFPPQVLEALKRGNKIEAIKLLKEAARVGIAEAKQVVDALESNTNPPTRPANPPKGIARKKHHAPGASNPYLARRPGLSPGEVPHDGSGMWWVVLVIGGLLLAYAIIANAPS
jgi:hypothetical protein